MTDARSVAEIRARCDKWKLAKAWHTDCGLCGGLDLAIDDVPFLLDRLAKAKEARDD